MYRGEMSNGISARIRWYTMWYSNITIYVYIPCIAKIREPKHDLSWFYTYVMYVSPYIRLHASAATHCSCFETDDSFGIEKNCETCYY